MATPSRDYRVGSPAPRPRFGAARPTRRQPRAVSHSPVNWLVVGAAGGVALAVVAALVVFCAAPGRTPRPVVVAPPAEEIAVAIVPEPAPLPPPVELPAAPEPGTLKPAGSAPPTDVRPGPGAADFAKGYAAPEPVRFRRRDLLSPDQLSRQLLAMPEVNLDSTAGIADAARLGNSKFVHPVLEPLLKRADLHGLPVAMGTDCQLGKESAENLQALSRKLRLYLSQSVPPGGLDPRIDAAMLRERMAKGADSRREDWRSADAVPTLVQMLQAEDRPVRLLLVELLAAIKGRAASAALAGRAVFDLSAEVREAAVRALADRPRDEYRGPLLDGLRYPWAPAADHAAEALVALNDRDALPQLTALLAESDPATPRPRAYDSLDPALFRAAPRAKYQLALNVVVLEQRPGEERRTVVLSNPDDLSDEVKASARKVWAVREVVRVNHMRNCLLCHAAATTATDPVRGLVPTPGQPLPPPTTPYYGGQNGLFVRADVTYLRQDFSVPQPVPDAGVWPAHQRYDYVVRMRYPTADELRRKASETYPQRETVRWALHELGAKDG